MAEDKVTERAFEMLSLQGSEGYSSAEGGDSLALLLQLQEHLTNIGACGPSQVHKDSS